MRTLTTACMVALLGLSVSSAYGQDAAKAKLAEELLDAMNMRGVVEQTFAMMKKMLPAQMEQQRKSLSAIEQDEAATKERMQHMDEFIKK